MRHRLSVPALFLTASLALASPWEDLVQRRKGADPRLAKWTLCVRQGEFPTVEAYQDSVFQKLLSSGDFVLETLSSGAAQDLWSRKGWGPEPHWVLLSPAGEELGGGSGRPRCGEVLDRIHATGAMPRWEAREAFLKDHPEQGEARLEALNQAFQVLRARLQVMDREGKVRVPAWHADPAQRNAYVSPRISIAGGAQGESTADDLYREVADHLEQLMRLPGWEQEASSVASHLAYWDVGQSFRMKRLFSQAAGNLEEGLRQDPYDVDTANFWMEACDAAGMAKDNLAGLCLPVPGAPWPDPGLLSRFLEPSYRKKDWTSALKLLADLAPQSPPEPMSASGWDSYCRLQCAIQAQRALALAGLGSWDLAGTALLEARYWGGGGGVREALLARGSLFTGPGGDANSWRRLMAQSLGRDGEAPAMPAQDPTLRLVVGGMPKWILPWGNLRDAPELALWSPAELRWEVADREAHEKRRAQYGWGPGPRWALFRGEEVRASGVTCPDARALAATLDGEGTSMLQRLQMLLSTKPDHLAARRERYDLVAKRMPDRRLEPLMAEDAAWALITLEFDPQAAWKPDPSLWAEAAQKALPKLEESIRSWPNRSYLWRAWISWARFHPAQPSVLTLAQGVAFWSPRWDWRTALPFEVQREVAKELRRQRNFMVMRDWFRAVWETLDQRPLRMLHVGERSWVMERRREEETAVFQPLRDALAALGCVQEQTELERLFGEMTGRNGARRK